MTQNNPLFPPRGALRAVMEYIQNQATYPIPEVAFAAGLGLFAGIAGRAWQTPDPMAGLNLYLMLAIPTGQGKDAGQLGISRLMGAVERGEGDGALREIPAARQFVGPSRFASEPALLRHVADVSRSFVSIMPEGGKDIGRMIDPRASQHDRDVGSMLLKMYGSSAYGSVFRGTSYAEKSKNIPDIQAPAISIYAEGTPSTVFANVTEETMSDGLIPRFLIMESKGAWSDINTNPQYDPPEHLVGLLKMLCERSFKLNQQNKVVQVQVTQDAKDLLDRFRVALRNLMEKANNDVAGSLWSRSHLRAVKMASLAAIGENFDVPTITYDLAVWAVNLEQYATNAISKRVDTGEVGGKVNDDVKQTNALIAAIQHYADTPYHLFRNPRFTKEMHEACVVPLSYLQSKLSDTAPFRNGSGGARATLHRILKSMVDAGDLNKIDPVNMKTKYKRNGEAYVVGNPELFDH